MSALPYELNHLMLVFRRNYCYHAWLTPIHDAFNISHLIITHHQGAKRVFPAINQLAFVQWRSSLLNQGDRAIREYHGYLTLNICFQANTTRTVWYVTSEAV
jgi:hypothetical protein